MDLTAGPVVVASVGLAVVAVVAVPWTWQRWRHPQAVRSALVLLATAAVLLAGAAAVNRQAGFFPTAHSLVSGQGAEIRVGRDGVLAALPPNVRPVDLSAVAAERRADHGAVVEVQLSGSISGLRRSGAVYLPAAYFDPAQAQVRFPVLEVLSGSPGSPAQTLHLLRLAEVLDAGVAAHQVAPTVVVVPDTNGSTVHDRECVDAAGSTQDDTYLTSDVQSFLGQRFRVLPPGRSWGLMGTSTGGYCAVNLALRHPDRYAAAASLSGYFHALTDVTTGDLFHGPALRQANDPTWRVQNLPLPAVALWLSAGTGEVRELDDLRDFAAVLPASADVTTVVGPGAGHAVPAWAALLPQALSWVSSRLPPATAPPPLLPGQSAVSGRAG